MAKYIKKVGENIKKKKKKKLKKAEKTAVVAVCFFCFFVLKNKILAEFFSKKVQAPPALFC